MLPRLALSNLVALSLVGCVPPLPVIEADCPCADGFVCSAEGDCVPPTEAPDGGIGPPDSGVDGGVAEDGSTDSGTPDSGPAGPCDLCLPDQACFEDACVEYVDLATIYNTTCAVMKRGKVACWGQRLSRTPWIVENLEDAKEVAMGMGTNCAIREGGKVSCWSYYFVQENFALEAEEVPFSGPVRAVRAGGNAPGGGFICGLLEDRSIECLGNNDYGQYGVARPSSPVPVTVRHSPAFRNPTHLFGMWNYTCVVHGPDAEHLSCFGPNFPQGIDAQTGHFRAVGPHSERILTDTGIYVLDLNRGALRQLTGTPGRVVNVGRTCRIYQGGRLDCRSVLDPYGYLPLTIFGEYAPYGLRTMVRPSGVVEATAGSTQVCFRDERSRVYCLGHDQAGELGVDGTRPRDGREEQRALSDVDALIAGHESACGLLGGALVCWGYNADNMGHLGRFGGGLSRRHVPFERRVLEASLFGGDSTGARGLAALLDTPRGRRVQVYGPAPLEGQGTFAGPLVPRDIPALDGARHIVTGSDELCGQMPDLSIRCVNGSGVEEIGQLADAWPVALEQKGRYRLGIHDQRIVCVDRRGACPAGVGQIPMVTQVVAGDDHGLALTVGGEVHRFGASASMGASPPAAMPHLGVVTQLSAFDDHACVLDSTSRLSCWGRNDFGQAAPRLAVSEVLPATPHTLDERFVAVATGGRHTCAIREGRASVECWGKNDFCELGRCPGYLYESPTPVAAPSRQRTPP